MTTSSTTTPQIRAIEKSSVHRICSNQVIVDLSTSVKELLENSLDAGARSITITLTNYGAQEIEVKDDGSGIAVSELPALAQKHTTSKLSSFSDLLSVRSFGFRGEALSSLCAVSNVKVVTRCKEQVMATQVEYDHDGVMGEVKTASRTVSREDECGMAAQFCTNSSADPLLPFSASHQQVGTTITLSHLFSTFPVRRTQFLSHLKIEYAKLLNVLQAYAMIAKGVRLMVYHVKTCGAADLIQTAGVSNSGMLSPSQSSAAASSSSSSRTLVLSTHGSQLQSELISNIFGAKQLAVMQQIDHTLESTEEWKLKDYFEEDDEEARMAAASSSGVLSSPQPVPPAAASSSSPTSVASSTLVDASSAPTRIPYRISGSISLVGPRCGRSSSDRQYLYINSRPVDLPRFARVINDAYRACNAQTAYPVFILDLHLPRQSYDVNLTPNKREIMIHDESIVLAALKSYFVQLFQPSMYTYQVKSLKEFGITTSPSLSQSQSLSESQSYDDDDDASQTPEPLTASLSSPPTTSTYIEASNRAMSMFLSPEQEKQQSPLLQRSQSVVKSPVPTAASASTLNISPSLWNNKRLSPSPPPTALQVGSASTSQTHASSAAFMQTTPTKPPLFKTESLETFKKTPPIPPPSSILRHQSTPQLTSQHSFSSPSSSSPSSATSTSNVRSASSFLQRGRGGSSPNVPTVAAIKTEERETKRQKVEGETPLSRQSTLQLQRQHSSSPINLIDGDDSPPINLISPSPSATINTKLQTSPTQPIIFSSPASSSSSPDLFSYISSSPSPDISPEEPMIDVDGTDIDVVYQAREVQRQIHFDVDAITKFYSTSSNDQQSSDSSAASLLDRAATMLSPSVLETLNSASSLGASPSLSTSSSSSSTPSRVLSEDTMKRVISKEDFKQMQIIGQFNLGFIITKINQDLFIIDQHASDEKYRFETLQATTQINSQPLLNPLPLDLSPAMEVILRERIDVLRKNGFGIEIDEDEKQPHQTTEETKRQDDDEEMPHLDPSLHRRTSIRVRSLPFSKNLTFGRDDIYELCSLLSENHGSAMVRLPKVTAMFASRACRSSVMIGTSLTHAQMQRIVRHMGEIEQPWSCPHGRPTMRHLVDLNLLSEEERGTDTLSQQIGSEETQRIEYSEREEEHEEAAACACH